MKNITNIRRYECCLCHRAPEEIDDPDDGEEPSLRDGTPKIARTNISVAGMQKAFDICWQCGVSICSSFASGAKYFRDHNNPEPPPKRIA